MTTRPSFFLAGTTKGGTSSLHAWLRQHPGLFFPHRKELHYFCECPAPHLRAAPDEQAYLALFAGADGRPAGEASPCYLYYRETPGRLRDMSAHARILISLRDPAERFWSHYLMNEIYRPAHVTPEEVVARCLAGRHSTALDDLVGVGMYAEQVGRYLEVFGGDRVFVTFLEELAARPDPVVGEIFEFLGLPGAAVDTSIKEKQYVEPRHPVGHLLLRRPAFRRVGAGLVPPGVRRHLKTRWLGDPDRKPTVPEDVRALLRSVYAEDSHRLEELLRRPVPWDWHSSSGAEDRSI